MSPQAIVSIVLIVAFVLLLLINPKSHPKELFRKQLRIFYNAKTTSDTKKIYWLDVLSFFICPLGLSATFCFGLNFVLSEQTTELLLTIFSVFFTIIFSAFSLLSGFQGKDKVANNVASETSLALFMETEISVTEIIVLLITYILLYCSKNMEISGWIFKAMTFVSLLFAFFCLALILIIVKRIFSLSMDNNNN